MTSIKFFLTYFKHEPEEDESQGYRSYNYRLAVQVRDRPGKTFKAVGDCLPATG